MHAKLADRKNQSSALLLFRGEKTQAPNTSKPTQEKYNDTLGGLFQDGPHFIPAIGLSKRYGDTSFSSSLGMSEPDDA